MRIVLIACAAFAVLCAGIVEVAVSAAEARSATEKGDAAAQFRYGEMLREGVGVKKNIIEAVILKSQGEFIV